MLVRCACGDLRRERCAATRFFFSASYDNDNTTWQLYPQEPRIGPCSQHEVGHRVRKSLRLENNNRDHETGKYLKFPTDEHSTTRAHFPAHQGFPEMIQHTETIKVCFGQAQPEEIEAFCARQVDCPQVCLCIHDGI